MTVVLTNSLTDCNLRETLLQSHPVKTLLGSRFTKLYMCACSVMSDSLKPHRLQPSRLLCLWDFSGKNTGVGCHFLLQGLFLTQRANASPVSPALHVDSLPLSHQASPQKL